jgi:hypothetical protein
VVVVEDKCKNIRVPSDGRRGGHSKGTEAGEHYLVMVFDKVVVVEDECKNIRVPSDGRRGGHSKGNKAGERYLFMVFDKDPRWLWLRTNIIY